MSDIHRIGVDEIVRHFQELEDPRSAQGDCAMMDNLGK
jgi:hypothetical protein